MTLVKWDPFEGLVRRTSEPGFAPDYGLRYDGRDAVVTIEAPGLDDDDVEIEVTGRRLSIRGKRESREESTEGGRVVRSLRYGSFRRDFGLPQGVTADDVTASYDKGLLEVRVRNVVPEKAEPRRISIEST